MFRGTDYPSTGLSSNKSAGRSCAPFQLKDLTSLRVTRGPKLLAKEANFHLSQEVNLLLKIIICTYSEKHLEVLGSLHYMPTLKSFSFGTSTTPSGQNFLLRVSQHLAFFPWSPYYWKQEVELTLLLCKRSKKFSMVHSCRKQHAASLKAGELWHLMTALQHRFVTCEHLGLGNIKNRLLRRKITGSLTRDKCGQMAALHLSFRH